mgnify:CR=1 FL=1
MFSDPRFLIASLCLIILGLFAYEYYEGVQRLEEMRVFVLSNMS